MQPNGEHLQVIADYFKQAEIKLIVDKIFKFDQIRRAGCHWIMRTPPSPLHSPGPTLLSTDIGYRTDPMHAGHAGRRRSMLRSTACAARWLLISGTSLSRTGPRREEASAGPALRGPVPDQAAPGQCCGRACQGDTFECMHGQLHTTWSRQCYVWQHAASNMALRCYDAAFVAVLHAARQRNVCMTLAGRTTCFFKIRCCWITTCEGPHVCLVGGVRCTEW